MKNKNVFRTSLKAVAVMVLLSLGSGSVYAQLNLNKVKDKAKDVGSKKDKGSKSENSGNSSSNTESGADLAAKGDAEYANKNYKAALTYYEDAEKNGYTDGEMKMKMTECRKYANDSTTGTPEQKKQEALAEEALALIEAGKMDEGMNKLQEAYDACPTCADAAEMKKILGTRTQMDQLEAMKYNKPLVKDEGITSPMHQAHMKQIVFSKTNISKSGASESQLTNSFNLGDDIIGRVYLEKSEANEKNVTVADRSFLGSVYLRVTIDGNKQYSHNLNIVKSKQDLERQYQTNSGDYDTELAGGEVTTTFRFGISEKQDFFVKNLPYVTIYENLWSLPAGNHKIKMEYVYDIPDDEISPKGDMESYLYTTKFGPEKVLATGEFNLNVTEAGKIIAAKKVCPKIEWYNNKLIKVPDGFTMINREKKSTETIIKVVELDNDWTYEKSYVGVILRRYINGAAIVQDNATGLYHTEDIKFSQENTSSGGSTYGKVMYTRSAYKDFCKECLAK
ncbi:MAG TPA: hypothetical protein VK177_15375 [Flavobacteriales bacterium]|nr:hypothetical protein [Flavobacteriales bacterium]